MSRKIGLRKLLGVVLTFIFLLSFSGATAFAAQTKVVTVTVPTTVTCPDYAISSVLQSIANNSSYSYNDGAYKGTLSYVGYSNFTSTYAYSYPGVSFYNYTFDRTYTGTVTEIERVTKTVTATRHYDITAPAEAFNSIQQGIASSTYSYDDGSFKGTLNYVSLSNWSATPSQQYPGTTLYHITFDVTYSGTVTSY